MKNLDLCILALILWIGCGVISAGFINASYRGNYPSLYKDAKWAKDKCAHFYGMAIIFGPVNLILSPFTTGFYQHGYHATCEPIQ